MTDRPDLAAMVVPLGRDLLAMEAPILDEHGISMWAYIVLSRLADEPVRGQSVLADAIGADKTRLIPVLDDLQHRGLIGRDPDPADRRARVLTLTEEGRQVRERVRTAIRREEQRRLAVLTAEERAVLLGALQRLTGRA
ncbi:MarR family winged helix-turn-helix transcriptional regulator [Pseudonocardia endophytica]|uniref:DNA-binding MarR family transcriptional regulator n=1 Tax=Pseudonocardia endophytica TaxID=401976 RepID=A0A4V2PIG8_PSEEN|nr:MarR family transcriptional regulator [Pseudonocardia endophytica]TCK24556.1 DNA-binding MarR family transcriptional regulator [Pseudonocardia endophytica]